MDKKIDLNELLKELNAKLKWTEFKVHNKDCLFYSFDNVSVVIFKTDFLKIYNFITKHKLDIFISTKGIVIHK